MSKYESQNQDYRWILTAIDVFSRYAFAVPLRRKHKEFTVNTVQTLLNQFEKKFEKLPHVIQMDDGGEFKNTRVLPLLESKGIKYFSTRVTYKKASIVERFNRTLKTHMWKFFNDEGSKEWVYVLDSLVQNINESVNRTIGISPVDVNDKTEAPVLCQIIWTSSPSCSAKI